MSVRPGSVVRFRHREWIVLPSDNPEVVLLRPLTGTTEDAVPIHSWISQLLGSSLLSERLEPARFPPPDPTRLTDAEAVRLLAQAARLLLREGAAPLRSLGRISVRPRPYQLVPLLMALRLNPVRLLIADDVGVGKTIEAGLIARELWDSQEIHRFIVLCPPPLTDQWATELREKFHFDPVVVAPATLAALERTLPPGRPVYRHFPVIVASLDFLKLPRHREHFLEDAPELVIVDEAHGVVPASSAEQDPRHLRYELVLKLASNPQRHLLLLTATPHSGIERAFQRLLGLLHPDFEQWDPDQLDREQRDRLARHLVQRTRADIRDQWPEAADYYPQRRTVERPYTLSEPYGQLFRETFEFCRQLVERSRELPDRRRRFQWWAALTLLRCVMSSPQAAVEALTRRELPTDDSAEGEILLTGNGLEDEEPEALETTELRPSDEVPTPRLERATMQLLSPTDADRRRLAALARQAQRLVEDTAQDTKLQTCLSTVQELVAAGHHPIVWCFFVDTAEYVATQLRRTLHQAFPNLKVECVTGRLGDEERRDRVAALAQAPQRVLVATDCLSEGVNLQEYFDAVLHYDLPWNPNRLEQREGRVDRFGQRRAEVVVVRLYGQDNPVDAEVMSILLEKADRIRRALGTTVPLPEYEGWLAELLVHRLFERPRQLQLHLPLGPDPTETLERVWDESAERERKRRTVFAQHALNPTIVMQELAACDTVLGDEQAVHDFVAAAAQRLGAQVQPEPNRVLRLSRLAELPEPVRHALPRGLQGAWRLAFTYPKPEETEWVGRNHPFVTALAHHLFELALERPDNTAAVARIGVLRTRRVSEVTTLMVLRTRFLLRRPEHAELVLEEVMTLGCDLFATQWLDPDTARNLLDSVRPEAEIPLAERREFAEHALQVLQAQLEQPEPTGPLASVLKDRAARLEQAHRRLRAAAELPRREVTVQPLWPPDLIALVVLQPNLDLTP